MRILGTDGRVSGIEIERNVVDGDRVRGTGEITTLDVGLVVRAIGYDAQPIPGLPFDAATGTVPNEGGRVVRDGEPVPGAYVTGWIKRGPTGVIGTNKGDGIETAKAVLADLPTLPAPAHPEPEALRAALAEHGVRRGGLDGLAAPRRRGDPPRRPARRRPRQGRDHRRDDPPRPRRGAHEPVLGRHLPLIEPVVVPPDAAVARQTTCRSPRRQFCSSG